MKHVERDPFDLFLERCAREVELGRVEREGSKEISEDICPECLSPVVAGSRHCPQCGAFRSIPEGVAGTFKPKTVVKQLLAITLLGIEGEISIEGRNYTRVHLKIRNLSPKRVHISLTYVDSVMVDVTGRQHSPVEPDEFAADPHEDIFPMWFYIYPDAFKDGVLLFRESPVPIQRVIICAMHQESEDEMFVFDLTTPPNMRD
jgi:hypothetical protein